MRPLLISTALAALVLSSQAFAQATSSASGAADRTGVRVKSYSLPRSGFGSGTQLYGAEGQGNPGVAEPDPSRYDTGRAPTPRSADIAWTGTPSELDAHQAACAERYRTYDPATDMFYAKPGVQRRCAL